MKIKNLIKSAVAQLVALSVSIVILLPLVMILLNSFKTKREANAMSLSFPTTWEWSNYAIVFEKGKIASSFINSCIYSLFPSIFVVMIASLATYVLARSVSKTTYYIYLLIILGIFLPVNYLAIIKIFSTFNLYGKQLGVILYYMGANIPFSVFIGFGYFNNIPRELDEAAFIDGATPLRTFFSIIFPLLKPISVTIFILVFMGIWTDFVTPLYLINKTSLWPMNLAIFNFYGKYDAQWNLVFADIVVTIIPVLVVYLICQKYIVAGLTSGSVKG